MLKQELLEKLKEYMKTKENVKKNAIQNVRAGILKFEKDNKIEADDEKVLDIISHEIKLLNDSLKDFKEAERDDLISEATEQIETLQIFMPAQLSREEVKQILEELKQENGFETVKDLGALMKLAKAKIGKQSDGKTISEIAKEILNG